MENAVPLILWLFLIGAALYHFLIKKNRNRKAAQSGQDLETVKAAVTPFLDGSGAPILYAHWEERESYGRTVKTTFHRYALTFQDHTLTLFPLGIDKKTRQVQAARPLVFTPENLGKVTLTVKEKNGSPYRLDLWLGDKEGHVLQQLTVDAENLRKSRWFPMNILQPQECQSLHAFLTALSQQVAAQNPDIDAKIKAENNEGLGLLGAGIAVAGALRVFSFLPSASSSASSAGP